MNVVSKEFEVIGDALHPQLAEHFKTAPAQQVDCPLFFEPSPQMVKRLFEWDKIYNNPLYGACRPQIDFRKLMRLYKKGDLKLDEMNTREYKLDDLNTPFDGLPKGKNEKGVVVFD